MEPNTQPSTPNFSGLGIAPDFLEILSKLKYAQPTPIQTQAIPVAMDGQDVVGIAQTGTGKTLAFGLPMIQRLQAEKGARGLVVLPTRELAIQVDESLRKIGGHLGLKTVILIGGTSLQPQISALARSPHIIIATPGRLNDHLQQKTVKLDEVRIVVLDEADRMLDMGFAPQIKKIFATLPSRRQTMLFSATMPYEIMKIATTYMKTPIRIEVAPAGSTVDKITQEVFMLPKEAKNRLIEKLLNDYRGATLIFTRTKHTAKRLTLAIREMGHTVAELHSNRSLSQRRDALEGFKSGKYRVLIATDIASRGIDVVGIELVINYDLPAAAEDYVHRIGRTARAGAGGHAISFIAPDQKRELHAIERLINQTITISYLPELPPARPAPFMPRNEMGPRRPTTGGKGRPNFGSPRSGGSRPGRPHRGGNSFGGHFRRRRP
ncbi:DEAD/DEAH box helicase [Candidatus Microgenomates bacterium]|nr:DEAD/DEAH box helicase [Candidatus Microgenomates bacterium]